MAERNVEALPAVTVAALALRIDTSSVHADRVSDDERMPLARIIGPRRR